MHSLVCWNPLAFANQNIWNILSLIIVTMHTRKKWQFKVSLPCTFSVGDWVPSAEITEHQLENKGPRLLASIQILQW
jgi:hypothetical protein